MESNHNLPTKVETLPEGETVDVKRLHDFYDWKRDKNDPRTINIRLDKLRIIRKLKELGFFRYDTPEGAYMYVNVKDRKLSLTDQVKITDAFEDYVLRLPDYHTDNFIEAPSTEDDGDPIRMEAVITANKILDTLYAGDMNRYFGLLDRLRPDRPIEIMGDTRTTKYYYFNNVIVAASKDGHRIIPYGSDEIHGCIWQSAIIDRNFTYIEAPGDFEKFCHNVTSIGEPKEAQKRFAALQSVLGYLVHDFYETDLKAVLFTDVNKLQAGKASGRTGKGLLGKACAQVLNRTRTDTKYVAIAGKGFDHNTGNGTCYSLADISTQMIHIEDIEAKKFDFEDLYNDITDGAKIRKNYDRYPIVKHIKFMLSCNQTIDLSGSSSKGRVCVFELSNYYSDRFRPIDEFKKRFFESDWSDIDWNQFYSFMVRCSVEYLKNGLQEPGMVNYSERRVVEKLGQEITDFVRSFMRRYPHPEEGTRFEIDKDLIKNTYQSENKTVIDRGRCTSWFKTYFDIMGISYKEKRSTTDIFIINPISADFA